MHTSASTTPNTSRPSPVGEASALKSTGSDAAEQALAQLVAALASDRPIGYSANLARVAGDAKAGLLLSQLMYWTRVGVDIESQDGWITKSREQWTHETGLSRCEQETARQVLLGAGLIEETRIGMPARLAFRVCLQAVSTSLARLLNSEPVQWSLFDGRSNADQVRALLGRNMAFYRVYSEITGSTAQAIFMARAMQAQRALASTGAHSDWFTFSPAGWAVETGLTAAQLRTSKQKLCQSFYLEQAMMQYPKRRTVLRLRLTELTAAVVSLRLQRMNDGKAIGGLLGAIGRSAKPNEIERTVKVSVPQRRHSSKTSSPAKSHQQGNRTVSALNTVANGDVRQFGEVLSRITLRHFGEPTASQGISAALAKTDQQGNRTVSALHPVVSGDVRQFGEVCHADTLRHFGEPVQKLPQNTCSAESADLDGRFSHAKNLHLKPSGPSLCEIPQAGFDRSVGRFSHASWPVLAALHAGARSLTTKEMTTTPPTPSTGIRADQPAPGGGGGGGLFKSGFGRSAPGHGAGGAGSAVTLTVPTAAAAAVAPSADAVLRQAPPNSDCLAAQVQDSEQAALIWPNLSPALLMAVQRMVREHRVASVLSTSRMQLLLDELASVAARGQLRVPTAYLSNLLIKEAAGTLDLSAAYEWQARREVKARHELDRESQMARSRQAAQAFAASAAAGSIPHSPEKTSQQAAAVTTPRPPLAVADPAAQAVWSECLVLLQPRLGSQHVHLWLNPLVPAAFSPSQLVLVCPSRFKLDHIKSAYLPQMNEALAQVMNARSQERAAASAWSCHLTTSFQPKVQAS